MRLRLLVGGITLSLFGWAAACSSSDSTSDTSDGGADGATSDGSSTIDGSVGDDGSSAGDGAPKDGSTSDAGDASANDAADANVPAPTLIAISPEDGTIGTGFVLCADAMGVLPGARIVFGGVPLTPVTPDAGADAGLDGGAGVTSLCGTVPDGMMNVAGSIAVVVENAPGNAASASLALFVEVPQVGGGPVVYDIHVDHGATGDTANLVGSNLGGALTLTDPGSMSTSASNDGGTLSWPGIGISELAAFTVPAGWKTGQITVTSDAGAPFRTRYFHVGTNVAPAGTANATTEYGGWPVTRAHDDDLRTSWFAANGDCASNLSCTSIPAVTVALAAPAPIGHVAIRGNREYQAGYDIFHGRIEILGMDSDAGAGDAGAPILFTAHVALSNPMRDVDVRVSPPILGAAVRFVSEEDESIEPGLSEIEIYGN